MRPGPTVEPVTVAVDASPLLGEATGIGVFCREAIKALAFAGDVDVTAFAVTWRRRHMLNGRVPASVKVVGRAMPARPLQLAWSHFDFPYIEWFTGPADVVHGTNFVVPPTRKAARVVTVHDLTTILYPEMCDEPTLRFPALIRRAVADGAWVHTPSEYVAGEVVDVLNVDPERVRAVHHGTPTSNSLKVYGDWILSSRGSDDPAAPIALPKGCSRFILSIGTAEPRKDLPGLVRSFDKLAGRLKDVALILVGKPGWGSEALGQALDASPFRSRISVLGYVEDLQFLLQRAAVLAYPSLYEGFGLPTLEAMAAGVPVVTTSAGALPEVVGDAAIMVEPKNSDALAAAIELVLNDDAERALMIERGTKRAAMFTWEACAKGLTDLYRDASKSGP